MREKYTQIANSNQTLGFVSKSIVSCKAVIALLFVLFGFQINFAQSDNCAATPTLSVGTSCVTTNYNVTSAFGESGVVASCGASFRDGWFTFTTDATTSMITINGTSDRRLGLALYSGTCGALTEISCSVPNSANASLTNVSVLPSTTYRLRLMRTNNAGGNDMTGTICVYKIESIVPTTGNNSYSMCSGNLYDSGGSAGNYVNSSNGYTVINPSILGNLIRVSGSITAEAGYDYLTIYDGTGTGGTVLWGGAAHGTGFACTTFAVPAITSTTGPLTVRFFSDGSTNCSGFNLTVSCVASTPPTITSLGSTNGCVGSSLVINGTNLSGATAVTIGGTAAAITSNTAATVTVTVGTGTTGTVQVTTPGGSATSVATFTVNPLPANPGNPTSNSPQCNPPGVTLTRAGTPPAGVTWYWQTTALGTSTTNSAATNVVTTSNTYYLRAQNNTTGCWSTGSGSLAVVINTIPTAVATPTPTNAATGICYAGTGAVSSISWGASAGATSYDVYFGAGSVPGAVTANVATNTYNTGVLAANTTYYWRIVAKNACGNAVTSSTFSFTTATGVCYCASNATSTADSAISNVTFNTINNSTTACTGYTNFTSISTTVIKLSSYNLTIAKNSCSGGTNYTGRFAAWIDWNQNGIFEAGEQVLTDAAASVGPITIAVTVPVGATSGATRMRCIFVEGTTVPSACGTYTWGETEDYTVNVIDPTPCVAPTMQPTALVLTPASGVITGTFAAAVPAPNSYLVVASTSATPPAGPVNGTSYTIGSTLGAGYTVVDNDGNTSFTASGLAPLTTYYFYIYSFNNLCTGGPLYLVPSPLTGNATTLGVTYCIPTIAAAYQTATTHHIRKVEFIGTLQDIVNISTFPTVAPFGYTDYTGLATMAIQAKGEAVNIYVEAPTSGYIKAWIDWNRNGVFSDAGETVYDAGGIAQASTTLGFVVPTGIVSGDYRVRLRTSGRNISGSDAGAAWNSCSTNLAYYGETEDYILRIIDNCAAKITTVTDGYVCGSGTVTLNATGAGSPTGFRWYNAVGTLLGTTAIGTWVTPSIIATTEYYVTAYNATCESLYRTKVTAEVRPVPILSFATSNTEVCGENSTVALTATGDNEVLYLLNEKFEGGMGTFSNVHYVSNPAVNATTAWQVHTSPYVPTGTTWFPAIASNFGANNFAFLTSDIGTATPAPTYYTVDNGLVSNTVNSTGFLDLTLYFRMYFDRYFPDTTYPTEELMTVDVSINGGGTWTPLIPDIIDDRGYGSKFIPFAFNLNAYINQANLKVRIRYFTNTWANGAAVDDIQLYGTKPLSTALQWSGTPLPDVYTDAATTMPYVAGTPATTVYVKPALSQLETGSYTFTATATLTNGCNVSQNITINNKSTIWKGTVNNDWNNPNNWMPNVVPDITSCVIIPNVVNSSNIIGASYNAFGKTLIVKNGGRLDIQPNNTLTIKNTVTVDATGIFNLESTSSLVQQDNVANVGVINMKRTATAGALDYVYWSTPVAGFSINNVLPTTGTQYRYYWTPTIDNGGTYAGNFGNWAAAAGAMTTGRGYIKRGSGGTTNFIGNPNNGNISIPITRDTYNLVTPYVGPTLTPVTRDDDNWNLLGNPYPSAINAVDFLAANTNISGFVKVWTHGTLPVSAVDPFYQDFVLNYTTADYITTNGVGSTPPGYDGRIGAGQGFFVLMNHSAATPGTVVFNNGMRSNAHRNDQFYRSSDEQNRIWLNLVSPSNASSTTLVGYVSDATNNLDRDFDAIAQGVKTNFELYSIAESQELVIQGRSLPFNQDDEVTLGVSIPQNGIYTIAISTVDGLFANASQDIYLEDKQLGTFHDLRIAPYTFTGTTGTDENRFVLRYTNGRLGTDDLEVLANNILVVTNENVTIKSTNIAIQSVTIHDVLGRVISNKKNVNANTVTFDALQKNNTTLLVKIELANGTIVNKKVIF